MTVLPLSVQSWRPPNVDRRLWAARREFENLPRDFNHGPVDLTAQEAAA